MAIDIDRFKTRREESKATHSAGNKDRAEFWKPADQGYHGIYLCPPSSEMDDTPFIEIALHYAVGPENKTHVCLSKENTAFWSNPMQAAINRRNESLRKNGKPEWCIELDPDQGCPTCNECEDSDSRFDPKKIERMSAKTQWLCMVIPWWVMDLAGRKKVEFSDAARVIRPFFAGYKQWDGVCDVITLNGDITDPKAAVMVVIKREGKELKTKYAVSADVETQRAPLLLPKPVRSLLKNLEPGGDSDPFALIANLTRDYNAIVGYLEGAVVETRAAASTGDDPDGPPRCFKADCEPDEPECQACPWKVDCAEAVGVDVPPDIGAKIAEKAKPIAARVGPTVAARATTAPPARAAVKPAPKVIEEEVDEEEEEAPFEIEPEEEIRVAPRAATRPATTASTRPAAVRPGGTPARVATPTKPKDPDPEPEAEEGGDDDLDDFEAELERARKRKA